MLVKCRGCGQTGVSVILIPLVIIADHLLSPPVSQDDDGRVRVGADQRLPLWPGEQQ